MTMEDGLRNECNMLEAIADERVHLDNAGGAAGPY